MKFPINEKELVDTCRAQMVNEEETTSQGEETFIRDLAEMLNRAYAAGVHDGISEK